MGQTQRGRKNWCSEAVAVREGHPGVTGRDRDRQPGEQRQKRQGEELERARNVGLILQVGNREPPNPGREEETGCREAEGRRLVEAGVNKTPL